LIEVAQAAIEFSPSRTSRAGARNRARRDKLRAGWVGVRAGSCLAGTGFACNSAH